MVASEVEASVASTEPQAKSRDVSPTKDIPESHIAYENEVIVSGCDSHELLLVDPFGLLPCREGRVAAVRPNNDAEWNLIARGVGIDRIGQIVWSADVEFIGRLNDRSRASSVVDIPERQILRERDIVIFLGDQFGLKSRVNNFYPDKGPLQFSECSFADSRGVFSRFDGSTRIAHLTESDDDQADRSEKQSGGRGKQKPGIVGEITCQFQKLSIGILPCFFGIEITPGFFGWNYFHNDRRVVGSSLLLSVFLLV
jgi:hypothetical protein